MKKILTLCAMLLFSITLSKAQSPENSIATEPKVIEAIAPKYPKDALLLRAEQRVSVEVIINKKGIVFTAGLVQGHEIFANSSVAAARQWKFDESEQKKRTLIIAFVYRIADKQEDVGVTFLPPHRIEVVALDSERIKGDSSLYSSDDIPKVIKSVPPTYSQVARAAKVSGTVEVEVKVNKDGKVLLAKVTKGHPLLKALSISAAQKWEFNQSDKEERTANLIFVFRETERGEVEKVSFKSPYQIEIIAALYVINYSTSYKTKQK